MCGAAGGNEPLLLLGSASLALPALLAVLAQLNLGRSHSPAIALGLQSTGLMWCEERTSSRQVESKPAKRAEQSVQELPQTVFAPTASPRDETE